ncbi:MAG: hypothetical protein ACK4N5_23730, partial [Myxococcales bacterium]
LGAAFSTQGEDRRGVMDNGGQAIVKLTPRLPRFEPYAFGGVGVSRLNVLGAAEHDGVRDDVLVKVPVGAGLDYRLWNGERTDVTLGARGQFGLVFSEDAFVDALARSSDARFTLQLGAGF